MKKYLTVITFLLILLSTKLYAQTEYIYGDNGNKISFHVRKDMVILEHSSLKTTTQIAKLSDELGVTSTLEIGKGSTIVTIDTLKTSARKLLLNNTTQKFVTYVLEYEDGVLQIPTNEIFIKYKENASLEEALDKTDAHFSIKQVELFDKYNDIYRIIVEGTNTVELSRKLYESGLCEFAEPSFIRLIKPLNPYYSSQWGLSNTGQHGGTVGCDIKINDAWPITKGNSTIKVAVIDEGVDLTHPDLTANLLPGYDATDAALGGANGGPKGNDYHGTACAGIIAAIDNSIGIIGIAPNCKIIPVRKAYKNTTGNWVSYDDWTANAIRYSWETAGADILNNSWGGGSPSSTITSAIQTAVTTGRGGKGAIVIFAAGNNNGAVIYPASLSNVITVGAMSYCCQRKNPTSCDGEHWWGSNFGSQLDVVAPGVEIPTTKIGEYTNLFNGTSAAAPHVAGIAALILSVNPNLTEQQVRNIIERTAQKVGGYSYTTTPGRSNGTWNNEMGYGLVDAAAAVFEASPPPDISGPDLLCSSGGIYTVNDIPTGATLTWEYTSGVTELSRGSNWIQLKSVGTAEATITAVVYSTRISKTIWAGGPDGSYFDISGPTSLPLYATGEYTVYQNGGWSMHHDYNYTWMTSGIVNYIEPTTGTAWIIFNDEGTHSIYATFSNACGIGYTNMLYPINVYSSWNYYSYPNPASSTLTVELKNKHATAANAEKSSNAMKGAGITRTIQLYNQSKQLVREGVLSGNRLTLDVSALPNGTYFLNIAENGKVVEQQTVIVQH